MKLVRKMKIYSAVLLAVACGALTSCDFLDVVPAEQAGLPDATKDHDSTLGFLYSCYGGIKNPVYFADAEGSADEFTIPELWGYACQNVGFGLYTPQNLLDHRWGSLYRFIGQCHLFLKELPNAQGVTDAEKTAWAAEAKFMIAYYHFEVLRFYGPCPITDSYIDMETPKDQYCGRMHYDYVTDWVVDLLDEAANDLPTTRKSDEWGRASFAIAKALKAKVLLYAASPLWNGSFPYPTWENKVETPGYGKSLVSKTYDPQKWQRALDACEEAIQNATEGGFELYKDEERYTQESVKLPYIPGIENESAEGIAFRKKVMLMRYLVTTKPNEGNKEFVWGVNKGDDAMVMHSLPTRILKQSNGSWYSGYSGISPTLNTAENFYTSAGKLPAKDAEFTPESEWFKSGGVKDRESIIKLNIGREPRFYAWMGFDGGDYSTRIKDGNPLKLELRNEELQGLNPSLFNRDHCSTGYLSQKYLRPNAYVNATGSLSNPSAPRPLIRMAELYLNLAECQAALGQDAALANLNKVRNRAGIPSLTNSDVTNQMTLTDWVRSERFIELWGEGHRYFDVRRWVEGPKYFASGVRVALNAEQKQNPTIEEYNKRVKLARPYVWETRMYMAPVFYNEAYKNPQMVQAPGY